MRRPAVFLRRLLLPILIAWPALVQAGVQLVVDGVDERLQAAVRAGVELAQYGQRDVSAAQVRRLYARAPDQARAALEPFGYYEATVEGELEPLGKDWRVRLHVQPGPPVRVTQVALALDAQARAVPAIRQAARAVEHLQGQVLDHAAYEKARDGLSRELMANGFIDARLVRHRVEVRVAEHAARVDLAWQAGKRYRFGTVHFEGGPIRPEVLARWVPFQRGDYFQQDALLRLQQALTGTDYFKVVDVSPQLDEARRSGQVDVKVTLVPAKRTVYTGGPFVGTDTGPGLRAGMRRRWVNDRGHTLDNELVLAQRLQTLATLYSIPLPGPDLRAYNFGAKYRKADTDTSDSHTLELVANETRQWHGWTRTLGVHELAGTFTVGKRGGEPDNTFGLEHGRSTIAYAEGGLSRKQADDPGFVRRGWSVDLLARSSAGSLLADARFSQLLADLKWIHALGRRDRLILRADAGVIWTSDFSALPPQLRFFAGGDRSVRGYDYQSLGPRNRYGRVIGGERLLVGSSELEHYFTRDWGMAAFVDAGNAFNGSDYRPQVGAGLGVRWRSPVGLVRVDVGVPVRSDQQHGVQLHVVIGPDL